MKGCELLHFVWHLAAVFLNQRLAASLQALCLVSKKARRPNIGLKLRQRSVGIVGGRSVFFKKRLCDTINPFIRTLGR